MRRALPTLAVAVAVAIAGCGGGDDGGDENGEQASTTPGGCQQVEAPEPRQPEPQPKPKEELDPAADWSLVVRTNCGEFTIGLDPRTAPQAAASLVSLARGGWFEDTVFHRIAPGFVIQGGDPTATGGGGPGYTTVDTPPRDSYYTRGVVAMAKAGNEPRGAGGSQFFVVTGQDIGLPPDYAIVGEVTDGMDVVEKIGRLGDRTEQPTEPVVIESVEVVEG